MAKPEISIYIESKLDIPNEKAWFKAIIRQIMAALNITAPSELGLVITNNKVIQQLNKTYRDKDEPTDVLTFYMLPQQKLKEEVTFVVPPDGISHLGEIVISYPQAVYQADQKSHDIRHELLILIIHGVLHILGYDHEQPEEEKVMNAKEEEVLAKVISGK
jgi:probable rRNA maturation factor